VLKKPLARTLVIAMASIEYLKSNKEHVTPELQLSLATKLIFCYKSMPPIDFIVLQNHVF